MWDNIKTMFPEGGTITNEGWLSWEEISKRDKIELDTNTMCRNMIDSQLKHIWYADGTMDRYYTYNVFFPFNVDNQPLLNTYGQKIYNDLLLVKDLYE